MHADMMHLLFNPKHAKSKHMAPQTFGLCAAKS